MTIAQRYKKCASPLGQGCRGRLPLAPSLGFYKEESSSFRLATARISKVKYRANDLPKPLGASVKKPHLSQEPSPKLSVTPSEGYPSAPRRVFVTPLIHISQHAEGYQSGGADIRLAKLPHYIRYVHVPKASYTSGRMQEHSSKGRAANPSKNEQRRP